MFLYYNTGTWQGRQLFEEKFTEEVFEKKMKDCLEKAIVI